jgi:hypothetical protein
MKRHPAAPLQLDLLRGRLSPSGDELSRVLATIGQIEPLTFPEMIEALPEELREPGDWRLVIANHPHVVLWDELSEPAVRMLVRLFESRQVVLQPCNPALYSVADRQIDLPAISSMRAMLPNACWLTCTIGLGPTTGLCSDWIVGYSAGVPIN